MSESFSIEFISSIRDVEFGEWQNVVGNHYPFVQYQFFKALEDSKSIGHDSGWLPKHVTVRHQGRLVAAMPLFIKTHSYGEYVFDFQWANAYHQAGVDYYPKLVSAIPFTPASGCRLYIDQHYTYQQLLPMIIEAIQSLQLKEGYSSWHILFPPKEESVSLSQAAIPARVGMQYHWRNSDYKDFADFLNSCKLKRRKNIKRERKKVERQGLVIEVLEGESITNNVWQRFYLFYQMTYVKRSGHGGYLTAEFFQQIGKHMANDIVMIGAFDNKELIAASLFIKGSDVLYGRYWGCLKEYDFLHFELCYYQGIEYCIKNRLGSFDAGAQGEHKISRGFYPVKTYSNHLIFNQDFNQAIKRFINQESIIVEQMITEAEISLPYKQNSSNEKR